MKNTMNHKTKKIPKVKISENDLLSFGIDQLNIDPYWQDLYDPPQNNKKRKGNH